MVPEYSKKGSSTKAKQKVLLAIESSAIIWSHGQFQELRKVRETKELKSKGNPSHWLHLPHSKLLVGEVGCSRSFYFLR